MDHECQCKNTPVQEEALDVLSIPRAVRHPAILGAIDALPAEGTLLLKAPHIPNPLLEEVKGLEGTFSHEVVGDGPDEWLVRIRRGR